MQIIENHFNEWTPLYPIEEFCPKEKALFIDIETTGLSKEKTTLYLIGCGYYTENGFCTKLIFADNPSEELDVLNTFIDFLYNFTHLIHFNGTKFDIPYLEFKAKKYNLGNIFKSLNQVDVYQLSKPLRHLLFPQSMRQKCIEDFLGIERKDKFNGGELINVYHSYVSNRNDSDFNDLITHNIEDVIGMHKILPILHYLKLLDTNLTFQSIKQETYIDYEGIPRKELYISYTSSEQIPQSFQSKTNTMYLWANPKDNTMVFRLPIIEQEMKLFFENYRDYYYLPNDDTCIHKSVAMGLDKKQYIKASKNNCYIKKYGTFVKQPKSLFKPCFKSEYKDKSNFFLYPDSFDTTLADEYGNSLLASIINNKKK